MKTWRQLSIWVVGDYLLLAASRLDHSEVCVVQKSEWKDLKDGMENGLIFFRLWRVFWKALVVSEETSIVREKTQIVYLYAKEGSLRTRLYSHLKREQLERMLGKKKTPKNFFPQSSHSVSTTKAPKKALKHYDSPDPMGSDYLLHWQHNLVSWILFIWYCFFFSGTPNLRIFIMGPCIRFQLKVCVINQ